MRCTSLGVRGRGGGPGVERAARRCGAPPRPPVPPQRHDCPRLGRKAAARRAVLLRPTRAGRPQGRGELRDQPHRPVDRRRHQAPAPDADPVPGVSPSPLRSASPS
ncbi:hypothetical protein E4U92_30945 [Streptomyces galbus]|uniref:Uncharacterized protein n=1 Tax=Streptomyces galbus TaxID=33898 RepID=A0A4U5W8Z2_STRGB|nr:hypothetical protein E4U92_30945 [Streptomyces galbus]